MCGLLVDSIIYDICTVDNTVNVVVCNVHNHFGLHLLKELTLHIGFTTENKEKVFIGGNDCGIAGLK